MAEPLEAGDELPVEKTHLAVGDQGAGRQRRDRRDQIQEALGVVPTGTTDEPDPWSPAL